MDSSISSWLGNIACWIFALKVSVGFKRRKDESRTKHITIKTNIKGT